MSTIQTETVQSDTFSLEIYEETLLKAKQLGYTFPTVSELKNGAHKHGRFLLIRHDVDTSPSYALQMARLEHRLGVRSSYFVLMHCPYYNPAAPPHWDALREIIGMNFEVGLHYDTTFFEERGMDILEGVRRDAAALENILDVDIVSVSQHRPASSPFIKQLNEYYVDAYNNDLVNGIHYISDSGFKWRGRTLLDCLGTEERIHALIHPLTWMFGDLDMAGTYGRVGAELSASLNLSLEGLIDSTQQYLQNRERLDQTRRDRYKENAGGAA